MMERSKTIIKTSFLGIAVNLILVAFKAFVGLVSGSIAVILDAVNNLSDALSSAITIVGTKLSGKRPDKKHPYGYGRIEYITSAIIAVIVLLAGVSSLRESFEKTIHPEAAEYTPVSLVIIGAAIIAKVLIGLHFKKVGKSVASDSLSASGADALFDSILSLGVLIAALLSIFFNVTLEGIIGLVISLFIIKAGIEMLLETLGDIIGSRADSELTGKLRDKIRSFPEVRGVYDLTLHNYGPERIIATAHIELPDTMTAAEIHRLTRGISAEVYSQFGIILTIGIYASNDSSEIFSEIRAFAEEEAGKYPEILELHGFYGDEKEKTITFDLIIDFKADAESVRTEMLKTISNRYPQYSFFIILDSDFSD